MNMKKFLAALSVSAVVAAVATSANAAQQCKFYLKAAGGYTLANKLTYDATVKSSVGSGADVGVESKDFLLSDTKAHKGFLGEIGLGYHFTENLRADVAFRYQRAENKKMPVFDASAQSGIFFPTAKDTANLHSKITSYAGVATVYYDFSNTSPVTPFVLAGVGMERIDQKIMSDKTGNFDYLGGADSNGKTIVSKITKTLFYTDIDGSTGKAKDTDKGINELQSEKKNKALFQLGGGVAYKVSDSLYLDVTYKLSNFNSIAQKPFVIGYSTGEKSETLISSTGAFTNLKSKQTLQNSVLVGLRFSF
ncbi:exported hypothetical protein [Alphaproteobacteria bacterium]